MVSTYHHLLRALTLAASMEEKPRLYVQTWSMKIGNSLLKRIEDTNVFYSVDEINWKDYGPKFVADLKAVKNATPEQIDHIGNSIFEKHLTPYFDKIFQNADFEDSIYIFNDNDWHYYYVEKNFKSIIIVEDGYKGFKEFLSGSDYKRRAMLLAPFIGKYYPERNCVSPKIKTIISSCDFPELTSFYRDKLEILDLYEEINKYQAVTRDAVAHIFEFDKSKVENNSVIYLTQPLYKAQKATALQCYLLGKKVVKNELGEYNNIYIKPHPAETIDYDMLMGDFAQIIPKEFPSELFEIYGIGFDKAISGFSTSLNYLNSTKIKKKLFKAEDSNKQIKKEINLYIENEALEIDFYLKLKDLEPRTILDIFTFNFHHEFITSNIHVLVQNDIYEETKQKLDSLNIKKMIDNVIKKLSSTDKLIYKELYKSICTDTKNFDNIQIEKISDFKEKTIYNNCLNKSKSDYFMIVDKNNHGFEITQSIKKIFNRRLPFAITFDEYFIKNGKTKYLVNESYDGHISGRLSNRLWHHALINKIGENLNDTDQIVQASKTYNSAKYANNCSIKIDTDDCSGYINYEEGDLNSLEQPIITIREEYNKLIVSSGEFRSKDWEAVIEKYDFNNTENFIARLSFSLLSSIKIEQAGKGSVHRSEINGLSGIIGRLVENGGLSKAIKCYKIASKVKKQLGKIFKFSR